MRALDWIMLLAAMFLMFQTSVVSEKPTVKIGQSLKYTTYPCATITITKLYLRY